MTETCNACGHTIDPDGIDPCCEWAPGGSGRIAVLVASKPSGNGREHGEPRHACHPTED